MSQSAAVVICIVLWVLFFVSVWFFMFHLDLDSIFQTLVIPGVLIVAAFWATIWAADDNFYDVKSGVVIEHSFTAAHTTPVTCTPITTNGITTISCSGGTYVPDDWAIEIRNENGKSGWIHFTQDVFADYPVGARYPKLQ